MVLRISTATCGQREGGQFELTDTPLAVRAGLSTDAFRSAASPTAHKTRSMRDDSLQARWCVLDAFGWSGKRLSPESSQRLPQRRVFGAHGRRGVVEPGLGCRWHKPSAMLAPACPEALNLRERSILVAVPAPFLASQCV